MPEKRKATGFIWKESIYKNKFTCSCGNELANPETGKPKGYVLYDPEWNIIYCNRCMTPVCFFGEMETSLSPGLHGHIEDYLKNRK